MNKILDFEMPKKLELLRVALEQIQDWLVVTDIDGTILYVNEQVGKTSGYSKNEIIGQNPSIWQSGESTKETYKSLWDAILSGKPYYSVISNRRKNGEVFYLANTISPVNGEDGKIQYFVSTAKDITKNFELQEQLNNIIHYDSLTQLPNRTSFIKDIQEMVCPTSQSAILAISIKKINIVNNTYGFIYGDQIIKKVADKISKTLNKDYIFSRIESHVFAILVPRFENVSEIVSLINKIEQTVGNHMTLKGQELYIELSTGVGVSPTDATNGIGLLSKAQTALDKVHVDNNPHTYGFYSQEMDLEAQIQLQVENDVYRAYENDEFIPYFQPFIDIKTGEICGFEALMRRENSKGEIILPSQFIGILEQMGLIEKIELVFIEKVCEQIRKWMIDGEKIVPVAINISPLHFKNKNLVKKIINIVNKANIPRELITIEIIESMFIEDHELAKSILKELKEAGFTIAIDDFGTGYSSLSYLKEFNADHLKIDISFIEEIVTNKGDRAIVKAIIAMAKALNLKTVAEGIETGQQLEIIDELGCDIGQGHYWGVPMPANEIAIKYL